MVSSLMPIDDDITVQSARLGLEYTSVDVSKIGLIGSDEGVQAIHSILNDYPDIPVVLDPSLIGSDGMELADDDMVKSIRELLINHADIMTLSPAEAGILIPEADNLAAMMTGLMNKGCEHILLSGRRDTGTAVMNSLYHNYRVIEQFEWPRLDNEFYGAGCTLSASLAALLAQGLDHLSACREAQNYCWQSLKHGARYGMGQYQPSRLYWMHEEE